MTAFEDPDDKKLATLARATRARTRAAEGACVRDQDGRTYAGATVALENLRVSATGVALAMAVSSGVTSLEAVAVVTEGRLVAEGPADTVMSDPAAIDAYLGAHHDTDLGDDSLLSDETMEELAEEVAAEDAEREAEEQAEGLR